MRIWSHFLKKSLMENFIFLCSDSAWIFFMLLFFCCWFFVICFSFLLMLLLLLLCLCFVFQWCNNTVLHWSSFFFIFQKAPQWKYHFSAFFFCFCFFALSQRYQLYRHFNGSKFVVCEIDLSTNQYTFVAVIMRCWQLYCLSLLHLRIVNIKLKYWMQPVTVVQDSHENR